MKFSENCASEKELLAHLQVETAAIAKNAAGFLILKIPQTVGYESQIGNHRMWLLKGTDSVKVSQTILIVLLKGVSKEN